MLFRAPACLLFLSVPNLLFRSLSKRHQTPPHSVKKCQSEVVQCGTRWKADPRRSQESARDARRAREPLRTRLGLATSGDGNKGSKTARESATWFHPFFPISRDAVRGWGGAVLVGACARFL